MLTREHRFLSALYSVVLFVPMASISASVPVPHYTFTKRNPPLLATYKGDISSVPDTQLTSQVGTAQWDDQTSGGLKRHVEMVHKFYWTLTEFPIRYAVDKKFHIKETSGYKKTDKEEMQKTLEVGANAKWFGIGVNAKASLKVTDSEEQQWYEETVRETDETYKAHSIYCTWALMDELDTVVTVTGTDGKQQITSASFPVIAQIYEDDTPDPTGSVTRMALKGIFLKPASLKTVKVIEKF